MSYLYAEITIPMEASSKKPYQFPTSTTFQVKTAGIICQSGETDGSLNDYIKQNLLTW